MVRNPLISTLLSDFLSSKNNVKNTVYFQKVTGKKKLFFCRPEGHRRKQQDQELDPDPFIRGTDPQFRIHTTMPQWHGSGTLKKRQ
jgi:hypothetical protein